MVTDSEWSLAWRQVHSLKYQYQYKYFSFKYKYKYKYFTFKYKYQYQYMKIWKSVLKYNLGTSTSTQYYNTVTFYSNYVSISCRFWDIQCRNMSWPWNRGQRSLKVIEVVSFDRSCMVSYVFFSNFVPKTHRFEIFDM